MGASGSSNGSRPATSRPWASSTTSTPPFVFALSLRVTQDRAAAEDITQDVFVHVWTKAAAYDADTRQRTGVAGRHHPPPLGRPRPPRGRGPGPGGARPAAPAPTPPPDVAEAATSMVIGERVRETLASLPEDQRQAIELAYFGGRTFREVAALLGIPEGTAKSRIRLGMAKLTTALQGVAPWS